MLIFKILENINNIILFLNCYYYNKEIKKINDSNGDKESNNTLIKNMIQRMDPFILIPNICTHCI